MAHTMVKLTATVCAAALSVAVLGGCTSQQQTSAASQAQSDNRAYMTQVNQTMETLHTRLDGFSDAVSRGDVVTMRTQADNAFMALDEFEGQEAPDALKDVKQYYVDGSQQLENALNAYIQLYTEIDSATDAQPFDWSTYDQRLADIQSAYNSGIEKLQEGDKIAADLPQ